MAPVGTLDELANFLTDDFWYGGRHAFATTPADNQISVNLTALNAESKKLARWAFEAWEMVADIDFVEVSSGGELVFDDAPAGAYSTTDILGNTTTSAFVNVPANWVATYGASIDSYAFSTYVHEIGHALGLGHLGFYDGNAVYGSSETFANDSWQVSIMSYFDQGANTYVNASYANLLTPMIADVLAIQTLYGAPDASSATAGNTTWGANTTLTGYLGGFFDLLASGGSNPGLYSGAPVALTIYDRGGNDTLDLSFNSTNDHIDLRSGSFSNISGLIGNLGIARGTILENAIGGRGNNTIIGNAADNSLIGNNGADTLFGNNGADTLRGGGQADSIVGGSGADIVFGGNGADTVRLGDGDDLFNDNAQSDVYGSDLIFGGRGLDTINAGGGNDTLNGGGGSDVLRGGSQNDLLRGGNQNDLLIGNGGNDTIVGGQGSDEARMGDGGDLFRDTSQVQFGNDVVFGGRGNDQIELAGGNDTASGGDGADSFVFAQAINHDVITDYEVGSDVLVFDPALWGGGLSEQDVIDQAQVQNGNLVFTFSADHSLTLEGITSKVGLVDDLSFA
ncbi:M10 family metallopeptidase C-terminal domain-containing protein [Marinovum sp. 2_MG-2023]|uniref:M10 family metallopeptidase C-terminal domain-containing protein n=1 Tax=unclassified Marinovum TaxID=2647166 RepID=UPI0026E14388|nr:MULTISPECIES: M10 family metallopeptidase C-terminal domain-containing protein [unclassified Marinovum]MDO6732139.1 M10 family metallopeptidase C-terminal domain-containing protein [Marinovum sp. 2_MG-2023]MDO6781455.1 M10 family metallopeptidase C-terminal domain-containing protein [Marinovum sp. 1_MG-2023]